MVKKNFSSILARLNLLILSSLIDARDKTLVCKNRNRNKSQVFHRITTKKQIE
jgi:hypothetical protein